MINPTDIQFFENDETTRFKRSFGLNLGDFIKPDTWGFALPAFQESLELRHETTIEGDFLAWLTTHYGSDGSNMVAALMAKKLSSYVPDNSHCADMNAGKRAVYSQCYPVTGSWVVLHRPVEGYVHWPLTVTKQGYTGDWSVGSLEKTVSDKWKIDHLPTGSHFVGYARTKREAEALIQSIWDAHPESRSYLTNRTEHELSVPASEGDQAVISAIAAAVKNARIGR